MKNTLSPLLAFLPKQALALSVTVDPLTSRPLSEVAVSSPYTYATDNRAHPQGTVQDGVGRVDTFTILNPGTPSETFASANAEIDRFDAYGFHNFDFNGNALPRTAAGNMTFSNRARTSNVAARETRNRLILRRILHGISSAGEFLRHR